MRTVPVLFLNGEGAVFVDEENQDLLFFAGVAVYIDQKLFSVFGGVMMSFPPVC